MIPDITILTTDWLEELLRVAKEHPAFVAFTVNEIEVELKRRKENEN